MEKGYKRKPIMLNHDTIALLHIFKSKVGFSEALWVEDFPGMDRGYREDAEEAAKQLIEQLQGENNGAFMMALAKECFKDLREHDKMRGTKWCKETLRAIRKDSKDAI